MAASTQRSCSTTAPIAARTTASTTTRLPTANAASTVTEPVSESGPGAGDQNVLVSARCTIAVSAPMIESPVITV